MNFYCLLYVCSSVNKFIEKRKIPPCPIILVPQESLKLKNVNFYVFPVANDLVSTCRKFKIATLKEYIFLKE